MQAHQINCQKCSTLLSANGISWGPKQGYRVSRRNLDGSPIVGTISRPSVKGAKALCRSCAADAVANLKASH